MSRFSESGGLARVVWLCIAALSLSALLDSRRGAPGPALAVDAIQAAGLARASGYAPSDVWERARILGASYAILRPETLEARLSRAGAAPAGPRGWAIADEGLARRLEDSLARLGAADLLRRKNGVRVLEIPEGAGAADISLGYDPESLAAAAGRGLAPVYWIGQPAHARLAGVESGAIWLLAPSVWSWDAADLERLGARISSSSVRAAWEPEPLRADPDARRAASALIAAGGRRLLEGAVPFSEGAPSAEAMRAARSAGRTLYGLKLDPGAPAEDSFSAWRAATRELKAGSAGPGSFPDFRPARPMSPLEQWARTWLAAALILLVPIAGIRLGLELLRGLRKSGTLPEASPMREILLSVGACAAVAGAGGALGRGLLASPQWELGLSPSAWARWVAAASAAAGFLALYVPDLEEWDLLSRRHAPAGRPWAVLAAAAACGLLLLEPSGLVSAAGGLLRGLPWSGGLGPRWREALAGYPALALGFWAQFRRLDASESGAHGTADPRPWILLGILGPAGTAGFLAQGREPLAEAVRGAGAALVLGAVLGLAAGLLARGVLALRRRA